MKASGASRASLPNSTASEQPAPGDAHATAFVLSFDVEEHHRIEAASGMEVDGPSRDVYRRRMAQTTGWILEQLAARQIHATFFIVGQIAVDEPALIRQIAAAGHEVASHGWEHRRIHSMDPACFREDTRKSKDMLEQAAGRPVVGYRAPTFSLVSRTAWAIDVLAELGFLYDSSIYPVRHDRYGIPNAPRRPFVAQGARDTILEVPPATVRFAGVNVPVGGGGYFRLLPWPITRAALALLGSDRSAGPTMLYYHPWEFDPDQPRLPLKRLSGFRTYVGIRHTRHRLERLLAGRRFVRACDLALHLNERRGDLAVFRPGS